MSDYIKKSDAIKLYKEYQPTMATNVIEFGEALADIPSADVVEVVRCGNCRRWTEHGGWTLGECELWRYETDGADFCSYGERRSDE